VRIAASLIAFAGLSSVAGAQHLNPMVDLLAKKQAVFGLYAPANPRGPRPGGGGPGGPGGAAPGAQPPSANPAPAAPATPPKTPAELAKDALGFAPADYIFDGSMECGRGPTNECFDRSYTSFGEFVKGYMDAPVKERLKHPLVVKMHEVAPDPALAAANIGRQLNAGVSTVVLVGVESADEVKTAINAIRFKSKGGARSDDVGSAPAFWGLKEKDYREKADLWPLNPKGEILLWVIVESKAGLAKIKEIGAVPGIAVLFPGAGTLRGVFTTTNADGTRTYDAEGWEKAQQDVLATCKEVKVACGFPANTPDVMELRYKQGFGVFVIGWGENGFKTVEAGLKASGRSK
jgi:2-keto-3-deoxy-L-rhamnonate aldolase RhmA